MKGAYKFLPNSAPTARLAFLSSSWLIAAKALKMSGAPLPRARRVTPYTQVKEESTLSDMAVETC